MNNALMFSSKSDEWSTPPDFFAALNSEFDFTTDAACTPHNGMPVRQHIFDALECDWSDDGDYSEARVFVNPPYSRGKAAKFIAKASEEARNGATVVMLLPARTDTRAFHAHIWDAAAHRPRPGVEVRFLPGRLKFGGCKDPAPFPSMVVVFRP